MQYKKIRNKFIELFKSEPSLYRSPGRVNLIGEHTDYNDGFVLPAAIDKEIIVVYAEGDNPLKKMLVSDSLFAKV